MKTALFDYHLPRDQIAFEPSPVRRRCRLLYLNRKSGEVSHHRFDELPALLAPRDLLVINDTAVIPARLIGHKQGTGGQVEVFLLEKTARRQWRAMVRPGSRLREGTVIEFDHAGRQTSTLTAFVGAANDDGTREVEFRGQAPFDPWLARHGQVPLPPYIAREPVPRDRRDYQTVFARKPGAVAAPTAGLHFDRVLNDKLRRRRVGMAAITLHVGAGTFRPVTAENMEDHVLDSERFTVSAGVKRRIWRTRLSGQGNVIAVGTTVTRTLETIAARGVWDEPRERNQMDSGARLFTTETGRSNLFIRPGYQFRAINGLVTNFHLPRSSLLALVAAFAGLEPVLNAYRIAVREGYRFYSYGDAMLIL